jgi:hypothetical protein
MLNMPDDRPTDVDPNAPAASEQLARQRAIKQVERRRRFRVNATISALGMLILVAIWAISEFHNAGGWPTHGFS